LIVSRARRATTWILLVIQACFHPDYDHPMCGPRGECPGGLVCSAQLVCEQLADAATRGAGDAAIDPPGGMEADAATVSPPPFCDPADPHLVACYEFEGNTKDGSAHHLDATRTNVSFTTGQVGMAMQFVATSAADVADSPAFDIAQATIEAWIKPTQFASSGNRQNIIDVDRQYALFVHSDGTLTCPMVNVLSLTTLAKIPLNQWTHVACTYDGAMVTIYIDGAPSAAMAGTGSLGTNGTTGMSLAADNPPGSGSQLVGLIDELRLMSVARTAAQICADAGRTHCP
jgi:hypothetical protein